MVDEAIFSKHTIKDLCWRKRREQFKLNDFRNIIKTYAVIASISEKRGLE
jgi:hypothetical protein